MSKGKSNERKLGFQFYGAREQTGCWETGATKSGNTGGFKRVQRFKEFGRTGVKSRAARKRWDKGQLYIYQSKGGKAAK